MRALDATRRVGDRLRPKRFHAPSLDILNFLVADVTGALGPYVTVFLVTDRHWAVSDAGLVSTLGGWLGLTVQTPLGGLLDATDRKRGLLAAALAVLGVGALVIALWPAFWPVLAANAGMQIVGGIFGPAVAALTVGLFARRDLTRRMGRNAAFMRAGNLSIAVLAALVAWHFSARDVFLMVPVMAILAIIAALSVPHTAIDLRRARGLRSGEKEQEEPAHWRSLLHSRPLVVFGICGLLIQFADPPLLTLAAQRLGASHGGMGLIMTSACIAAQQGGMLPAAIVVGRWGDHLGHRWLLVTGFTIVAAQGVLTAFAGVSPYWLIPLQTFGGIGIGLFSALRPLLLADLMHGTGRYNLAQGAVATLYSLGATSSGYASEIVVARLGYDAAFLGCAAVAGAALGLLWFVMPEIQPDLG